MRRQAERRRVKKTSLISRSSLCWGAFHSPHPSIEDHNVNESRSTCIPIRFNLAPLSATIVAPLWAYGQTDGTNGEFPLVPATDGVFAPHSTLRVILPCPSWK